MKRAKEVQESRLDRRLQTGRCREAEPPTPPAEPIRSPPSPAARPASPRNASSYTVVARRYRPQRFEDVVGQDHVVRALRNAIRMNRIAQAYLFCGTRGVGKTSMARIFAKCLNCVKGPTEEPCQTCDICQSIALGQDVDVIEIDGASNNGVEQVRELRQNAALRPSRARYKIYYIDEVHMLSTGAFNALLKTLEEPPPHVKFFFATTEANKIPITVLSRCQRYDFAGITPEVIAVTLGEICRAGACRSRARGLADRRPPRQRLAARCAIAPGSAAGFRQPAADGRGRQRLAGDGERRAIAGDDRSPRRSRCRRGAAPARTERRRGRSTGGDPLRNHRFHA